MVKIIMKNEVHLCDCMDYIKDLPDNAFDLAIVDPPYGIERLSVKENNNPNSKYRRSMAKMVDSARKWNSKKPTIEYFKELFRVSRYQIIWGMNNFTLPETEYFIVWNKKQTVKNFASAELAWTNVKQPALVFNYSVHKMMHSQIKIHPTQKPVALYKWLLQNYAKPGQTIFDSHVGSGSIRIACHDMGFDFVGCEKDPDYWQAQEDRFQEHLKKGNELFTTEVYQERIFNLNEQ